MLFAHFAQQRAGRDEHDEVAEQAHFVVIHATHDVVRAQLARVLQAGCLYQLLQRMRRTTREIEHPLGLVSHHQRLLALRVLCCHACRALVSVAALCLTTAQRHQPHQVKHADNFARCTNRNTAAQVRADQRVVNQLQALFHRRTDMVVELHRRGAATAFSAIDDDKVRRGAGGQHGFDNRKPFPRVANAKLKADRFTA